MVRPSPSACGPGRQQRPGQPAHGRGPDDDAQLERAQVHVRTAYTTKTVMNEPKTG